ncbi:hypothetical protein Leucomu_03550 [Leucobacter muris]|uniref:Uncharacterized protein n=1 Tax=Leucobacter muris TaxID=1935379 RepID=A0ABX5QDI4_9MICO|nr:hypothetical protein [Leucobacter muris]QAB17117.1 hypothetical protein Leucomu_03550 [Leucobacter muris]
MSDWAFVATVALVVIYRLGAKWIDGRDQSDDETPPPGNDTLVETMPHEIRDDSERRIPDIRLGFQRE